MIRSALSSGAGQVDNPCQVQLGQSKDVHSGKNGITSTYYGRGLMKKLPYEAQLDDRILPLRTINSDPCRERASSSRVVVVAQGISEKKKSISDRHIINTHYFCVPDSSADTVDDWSRLR
jgi:hypothetical protein